MISQKFKIVGVFVLILILPWFLVGCDMGAEESYTNGDINISQFELDVTDNSGELEFDIIARSDEGIMSIEVESSEEAMSKDFSNESTARFSGVIDAYPGTDEDINLEEVDVDILSDEGNRKNSSKEHYVRKYDRYISNKDIEMGMFYWPVMGDHSWDKIAVGTPLVGEYSLDPDNFDYEVVNRHIDQMQRSGIDRLMLLTQESERDHQRMEYLKELDMFKELESFEIFYDMDKSLQWGHDIEQDMEYYRDNAFSSESYTKKNGRPVIYFWWPHTAYWNEDIRAELTEQYGSLVEFINEIRSILTLNGVEPYMVGDFNNIGLRYKEGELSEELTDYIKSFDAVTNWTGHHEEGTLIPWDEQYDFMKKTFKGYEQMSQDLDLEFMPAAFPGFDSMGNKAWDFNYLTPPNPYYFRKMLELVDEYRTTSFMHINTWSEWGEGHMVEPGYYHEYEEYPAFDEEYYGFDYLNEIKDFLQ